MPRAIWRGAVSFGMVSIPVKLYTATESKDISFRQLAREDLQPIKYLRWSPTLDREVQFDEIVRGYEYAKEHYVIIDDEDVAGLPVPSKHTIAITAFVTADEIDPVYFEKAYYLDPDEIGVKPYALLLRSMAERNLVAMGTLAIRQKEHLVALRPAGDHIMLETLFHPDEVRPYEGTSLGSIEVGAAEMQMASALIDMLRQPFDPAAYTDDYRAALLEMIRAKMDGGEIVAAEEPAPAPTVDLMAALRASIAAAEARRGAPTGSAEPSDTVDETREPVTASRGRRKKGEDGATATPPTFEASEPAEPPAAKPARTRRRTT